MFPQVYKLSGAQCPSNTPGISLKRIGMETTDCVLFTSWLLSGAKPVTFTKDPWFMWMVSSFGYQLQCLKCRGMVSQSSNVVGSWKLRTGRRPLASAMVYNHEVGHEYYCTGRCPSDSSKTG